MFLHSKVDLKKNNYKKIKIFFKILRKNKKITKKINYFLKKFKFLEIAGTFSNYF